MVFFAGIKEHFFRALKKKGKKKTFKTTASSGNKEYMFKYNINYTNLRKFGA